MSYAIRPQATIHFRFSVLDPDYPTSDKTLQSVTLPTTLSGGQLHIFAIGTRSAYNNIGISDDNTPAGADFDGGGASYSAQDFADPNGPGWNPGDTLTYQGINYIWPGVPLDRVTTT